MNQEMELNNQNNPKKKYLIYVVIVIVLLVLSFVAGLYIGGKNLNDNKECNAEPLDNKEDNAKSSNINNNKLKDDITEKYTHNLFDKTKVTKTADTSSELSKNIEIYDLYLKPGNSEYSKYKEIYIYGKNNNSQMVHVDVSIEFYDKDGYRIEKQTAYGEVYGNTEFVLNGYIIDDSYNYSSVKLIYKATKSKSYYTELSLSQLETNITKMNDENIILQIKNNYTGTDNKDAMLFINTACVYYKDGKIVHAVKGTGGTDIHKGETGEIKFYDSQLYINDDYKNRLKIEYDDYRIFVYGAYYVDDKNY